ERALREGVVGAGGARPVALLRDVTDTGGRPAYRAGGRRRVGRAVVAGAVAALGDVARAGGRTADGGALRVGRTARVRPGADLGGVTRAGGRPALDAGGNRAVGGAVGRRPGAELGRVAVAGERAALDGGGCELVDGAGVAH